MHAFVIKNEELKIKNRRNRQKVKRVFIWRCNNSVVEEIKVEQEKMQYVCVYVQITVICCKIRKKLNN